MRDVENYTWWKIHLSRCRKANKSFKLLFMFTSLDNTRKLTIFSFFCDCKNTQIHLWKQEEGAGEDGKGFFSVADGEDGTFLSSFYCCKWNPKREENKLSKMFREASGNICFCSTKIRHQQVSRNSIQAKARAGKFLITFFYQRTQDAEKIKKCLLCVWKDEPETFQTGAHWGRCCLIDE